jgi:hypothetical protein
LDFLWIGGHAICTKNVPEELKAVFAALTLEFVQGQPAFSKPLKHCCECLIMLLLGLAKNEYVVADVNCARDAVKTLADGVLKDFGGH